MAINDFEFEILGGDAFNEDDSLFNKESEKEGEETPDIKEKNNITDLNPEAIFGEQGAEESVGGEEDTKSEDSISKQNGSSPSIYSSIATALKEDGVLPDLDDEFLSSISGPDDFAEAIERQVTKRLDEAQQRIKDALDYGMEPQEVKQYESVLNYLDTITEKVLEDESEKGENVRKQLIYQDYVNRGFSEVRAKKEVDKSVTAGNDVEDAKDALESNREYYNKSYQTIVQDLKKDSDKEKKALQKQAEDLRKKVIDTEEPFEGIKVDKTQRMKIYEAITKPVHKGDNGQMLTEIQKFEKEHPIEFKSTLATLFVLTDGFKNLDTIVKGKVGKETRKSLREIEHALKNTPVVGGKLSLANSTDTNSYSGLNLDV